MAIEPITRKEQFLAKAGGQQVGDLKPITREEMFLQKIAENGGGSGGGVQPDLSQNDPNAADYVKNRTHYEETTVVNAPLNITWDGNTEGLVSVDDGHRTIYCKVSDATPTLEQLQNGGAVVVSYVPHNGGDPNDSLQELSGLGNLSESPETIVLLDKDNVGVVVIRTDEAFPGFEKGLYLTKSNAYGDDVDCYASALTTTEPVEHTKTVVKKLDKKFLPDNIGGGIKYVTIGMDDDDNYTTSATYAEIAEWINAGIDVRCIYGKHILPLVYSDAVGGISMMELAVRHEFACIGPTTEGNYGPAFLDVRINERKNSVEVSEIWLSEAT